VAVYLLEVYMPGSSEADLAQLGERLREVAHAIFQDGLRVRYLRSTYVPEDETCFHYVEASTSSEVELFAHRAGFSYDRILEARNVTVPTKGDHDD
jgi:hypothetical protein